MMIPSMVSTALILLDFRDANAILMFSKRFIRSRTSDEIIAGRYINDKDLAKGAHVCVIGEKQALKLYGGRSSVM